MMKQRQMNRSYRATYKKLDREKESGSESDEEIDLFIRKKQKRREIPVIDKILEESDTLQSLAIRYHCTIADLKRLNNIDKENEIFAKRRIKVPHYPITTALAAVHVSGRTSPNVSSETPEANLIDIDSFNSKLASSSLKKVDVEENKLKEIIFNSQLLQKECERVTETLAEDGCDEEVCLLPSRDKELLGADPVVKSLSCSGADGDISWVSLIICIVILIFAVPLIYVFYIAEHIENYQHHGS